MTPSANKIRHLSLQGCLEKRKVWQGTNSFSHVRSLSMFSDAKMPSLMDFQVLRVLDLHDCSNLHDGDIGDIGNLIRGI